MPTLLISQVHGGWREEDGYVAIPAGTNLHLFSEPGNVMLQSEADWGAVATADDLANLDGIQELFQTLANDEIVLDVENQRRWVEQMDFDEVGIEGMGAGFEEQMVEYTEKLRRAVAHLHGLAELTLVEGDVIYDYRVSSLDLPDQVFGGEMPGDPAVVRIRSEILGRVSDNDIMVGERAEYHLSEYLRNFQGWDIYWFACQVGAAVKPDEETRAMLDAANVKIV